MLSPLSRGYGTWTGNYDPYNDEREQDSDSLPDIEDPPHRHGITVGFVSRTPSATPLSPPFRTSSSRHGRDASLSASTYHTREATLSGKRTGSGREISPGHMSRENSDSQMNLPKTFLTRKGALLLFAASDEENKLLSEHADLHPRFMRVHKPVDVIDSSLKLGTMDKLALSVLKFGEEELDKDRSNISDEKNGLMMKFLNKMDERDVDEKSQPGGDVMFYLRDLKHKTSIQMGLSGDTALPRSREALELRAILRGLQNDNWPCTYKQEGADFKKPSALAYQYSRPPSHLNHPPRNHYQRILSSKKLEDSVLSLRSYLGRSLDDENSVPLLMRRHARHKKGDLDSARRSKYSRERSDDELRKNWSQRPHTNTPTPGEGIKDKYLSDEDEVEDEHQFDSKSSARDDGYHSVSQADTCSFVLGPHNWTPVQSQAPEEEISSNVPRVDVKKMVDKGSTDINGEGSIDEGLEGDGIVLDLGSDESDLDVECGRVEMPDDIVDMVEGNHRNNASIVHTDSFKCVSPELYKQDLLIKDKKSLSPSEIDGALFQQQTEFEKGNGKISYSTLYENQRDFSSNFDSRLLSVLKANNDILGTSCDELNIASDGDDVDYESKEISNNGTKVILNENVTKDEQSDIIKSRAINSASSHKRSRTPSSIHSTALDDDQSSITILPHDQDLISVNVRSAVSTQSLNNAQPLDEVSNSTDHHLTPESQTMVKDKESVVTGDDATSTIMSIGEDSSSTILQTLGDLHDEESRDKLGDITNQRLPLDDRGRIEMIEIPHPTTPRSTEITTEDKVSPRNKSESSSKLGEKIEDDIDPETMVSIQEDGKIVKRKTEYPEIPDFLRPKPPPKSSLKKDQRKKGQLTKDKKDSKTLVGSKSSKIVSTPSDVTKAIDITSVQHDEDKIIQIIRKKVTLPPDNESSVMPDFVSEAIKRSRERSKQQLEKEFREQQELIGKELGDTIYETDEGMTAEELELAKKALREKEELAKDKIFKGKQTPQQKKLDDKNRKSSGSLRSKKSKGATKDPLQLEKERIKALKEQEKQKRLEEIRALEEKIAAQSNSMTEDDKKFKDKLQEVQMELERIEREARMAEQTEADVRQALKEDRMKRLEEKARQKKEELARRRQMMFEKKQQERQLKEEAHQRELQKIMMLMDDEERKRKQEEQRQRQEEENREEERRRKEEEEEMARLEREEEERRRQLEDEIEQEQLKRLQEEQDELRRQQEAQAAKKLSLLEEERRKRELVALEKQRQMEELERKQQEEMRIKAEERARAEELLKLEEEVRENMRKDMEKRREEAIKKRETNLEAKSNLNKIRHSQGINRAWVWSYFVPWPLETYMRPVGEKEKKKKEAKLREKRKKAR